MRRSVNPSLIAVFLIMALGSPAAGGVLGVGGPYGEVTMAYPGPETLTLMVLPDGSGPAFDEARLPLGGIEDGTITLFLADGAWEPVANFPAEDMWLESRDGGLATCNGGTCADANTDAFGLAHWALPLHAGGHSESLVDVLVNGSRVEFAVGQALSFNSPDLNGDLMVNLTDVQLFSADFFSNDLFRSDFYRDGVVNLSDLPPMAAAVGTACP